MPVSFLTEAERQHRSAFPNEIAQADLITFFTLSSAALAQIRKQRGSANRFGFAPQLCALRYLGFFPQQQETIPDEVIGSEALRRGYVGLVLRPPTGDGIAAAAPSWLRVLSCAVVVGGVDSW